MDAAEAIAKLMDGEQVQDGWLSECLSHSGLKRTSTLNEEDILKLEPSAVKNLINEYAGLAPAVAEQKEALTELKKAEENIVFLENMVENTGGRNKESVADMRGSLKILTELDSAIKQKAIELFSDAFARVKEAFAAEFQKIITGGDAELRLSNPDDVYESGIEVYARFPDKDMVHSSCLSFREKTIVAFILVLAVQKHPNKSCMKEYMKKTVSNLKKLLDKGFAFLKGTRFRPMLMVLVAVLIAQPLSALKLPTGDNVRSKDVRMDGDALVEVVLGGDKASTITTPAGTVKALAGTPVTFYKSGALKSLYPSTEEGELTELLTPIGKLVLDSVWYPHDKEIDNPCEFYESGSPKRFFLNQTAVVTVGGREFGARKRSIFEPTCISFYDSGSKDVWLVKSLFGTDFDKDNVHRESVGYSNKSGNFEISLKVYQRHARIDFWPDGSIKSAPLYKSPDEPVLVKGNEVYIKGGESMYFNQYYRIDFFEDGSVRAFTPDEVCLTEQGGTKLTIVGDRRLCLWKNGNIQQCSISNGVRMTIGRTEYSLKGKWTYDFVVPMDDYDVFLFNEDGSIRGFAVNQDSWDPKNIGECMIAADGFYVTGTPHRTINVRGDYTNRRQEKNVRTEAYVDAFYNLDGDRFCPGETEISLMKDDVPVKKYLLQDGDLAVNVAHVTFGMDGIPKLYTLFRLDDWGDYLLDEYGIPIEDTETQKEFKK